LRKESRLSREKSLERACLSTSEGGADDDMIARVKLCDSTGIYAMTGWPFRCLALRVWQREGREEESNTTRQRFCGCGWTVDRAVLRQSIRGFLCEVQKEDLVLLCVTIIFSSSSHTS
jgi:hypothetical protein